MKILRDDGTTVKFRELGNILRERIKQGKYRVGEKLPSEKELVQEFSVSMITVRQAIELLVREGLVKKERGRGKGTKVLSATPMRANAREGLLFGTFFSVNHLSPESDMLEIMSGIIKSLNIWEANLTVLPFITEIDQKEYIRNIIRKKLVDGIFLFPMARYTEPVLNFLFGANFPCVYLHPDFVNNEEEMSQRFYNIIPKVLIDEEKGIKIFLQEIEKRGYKEITVIGFEGVQLQKLTKLMERVCFAKNKRFALNKVTIDTSDIIQSTKKTLKKYAGMNEHLFLIGTNEYLPYFDATASFLNLTFPNDISVVRFQHYAHTKSNELLKKYTVLDRNFEELGENGAKIMMDIITKIRGNKNANIFNGVTTLLYPILKNNSRLYTTIRDKMP